MFKAPQPGGPVNIRCLSCLGTLYKGKNALMLHTNTEDDKTPPLQRAELQILNGRSKPMKNAQKLRRVPTLRTVPRIFQEQKLQQSSRRSCIMLVKRRKGQERHRNIPTRHGLACQKQPCSVPVNPEEGTQK